MVGVSTARGRDCIKGRTIGKAENHCYRVKKLSPLKTRQSSFIGLNWIDKLHLLHHYSKVMWNRTGREGMQNPPYQERITDLFYIQKDYLTLFLHLKYLLSCTFPKFMFSMAQVVLGLSCVPLTSATILFYWIFPLHRPQMHHHSYLVPTLSLLFNYNIL